MDYRRLGESDLTVSAVCLGTMTWGQQNTAAEAHAQLDYAFGRGVNFIDTAEMYPVPPRAETCTRTETILGEWLARRPRDQVILASKVAGPRRNMAWIRGGPKALDRANIREAIEGSLRRLRTDYLDLYQLHWPERNVPMFGQYQFDPARETDALPIRDQLEALAELVREGKVRHVGVSNEQPWGLMQFLRLAEEAGLPRVVSIQNAYSLISRGFEFGLAEIAYRENVGLLAYSPLAFGHLTGKYLSSQSPGRPKIGLAPSGGGAGLEPDPGVQPIYPRGTGRITLFPGFGQRYEKPNVQPAVAAYAELARRHGLTPTELALSFVYRRGFVASTIVGATSLVQLEEDLGAWEKPLDAALLAEIEQLHLRYMNPAP